MKRPYDYNTFFILSLPEPALEAILKHCIEKDNSKCRWNNDRKKCIPKLSMHAPIPPVLIGKTPYTHDEIVIKIRDPEWNPPELI